MCLPNTQFPPMKEDMSSQYTVSTKQGRYVFPIHSSTNDGRICLPNAMFPPMRGKYVYLPFTQFPPMRNDVSYLCQWLALRYFKSIVRYSIYSTNPQCCGCCGSLKVSGSKGYKRNRLVTQLTCALRSNTFLGGSSHVEWQPCGAAAMWSSSHVEQQP